MPNDDLYKAPSFQFYPDDFTADTADLTAEEVGAYVRLMCHQWKQGGIPRDLTRQGLIAHVTPARMRVIGKTLASKYEPHPSDETLLIQPRLERVRKEAHERHDRFVNAGKRGGRPRQSEAEAEQNPGLSDEKPRLKPSESSPVSDLRTSESKDSSVAGAASAGGSATWFEPIREQVRGMASVVCRTLTLEQRIAVGRYIAHLWCVPHAGELENLRKGRTFAAQIEAVFAKQRFADKTVLEFLGAARRVFDAGRGRALHSLWDITAAFEAEA